ncbi:CTQ-dependent lysine 6-oxidase LodA [Pseudomonas xantholysinigenes]|uniref:CTQ-dependent lysine 6-oxidase LodA n=1 Tax=Pseudomonas xantholysinigenes TaxID=2745490 RepID=A0A9E6PUR4_9PSED|nr:CTQ-dependent lysine 6-oxidase LodA [Pseudomonas xantholysinigenes]QXI37744.1 CTQ-dependent lysine 6-oxidase LodA [Pseudomonas xantholysinigenes]
MKYVIGPSIGVARVGNSETGFYLAPEKIGGRPLECDGYGNQTLDPQQQPVYVTRYKDANGSVKRQAARFCIFAVDDNGKATELTLDSPGVESMTWSVHLANKKAIWYNFAELEGNLLLGAHNSYKQRHVSLRNDSVTDEADRQKLIIDPGPYQLSGRQGKVELSRDNTSNDYRFRSFPARATQGQQINTLGTLRTDAKGRLLVLGGHGHAGGNEPISSFAGADTWHDDVSDGPVTCTLKLANQPEQTLTAWCIVGSPKFAPELENIVTLDDLAFDVAVRELNLLPELYRDGQYQKSYIANYERDIEPILRRPAGYRWVAAIPSLNSFSPPPFDAKDNTQANQGKRQDYFSLFRNPGSNGFTDGAQAQLFDQKSGIPLMPLNSGSNSVSNDLLDKFLTLTRTQYFLLGQWAAGQFTVEPPKPLPGVSALDQASIGNCVGGPLCPGIEVTWSLYSPSLYAKPYQIRHRHDSDYYYAHGLSTTENETDPEGPFQGCEPGDLTKRMAIPWQADFYQCTVQNVNFTDPAVNKEDSVPKAPSYYAYWWPPQSPWNVIPADMTAAAQQASGISAGMQSIYSRGINGYTEMIQAWHYLGFITNEAQGPLRDLYPYFVETERNNDRFVAASFAIGPAEYVLNGASGNFFNTWYLKPDEKLPSIDARQVVTARGHLVR